MRWLFFFFLALTTILGAILLNGGQLPFGWQWSQLPEIAKVPEVGTGIVLRIFFGILLFLLLLGVIFLLTVPLYAHKLVNQPNKNGERKKSGFHLFTFLAEGQAKWIVRGERPVRAIMLYANHKFRNNSDGETRYNNPNYWEVVEATTQNPQQHPISCSWGRWYLVLPFLIALWARYVYWLSGAVFTGIYPFQRVYEYPLERTKVNRQNQSELHLEVKDDYSDHFRVREFIVYVRIAKADTKDKISVDVLVAFRVQVCNPHKAAFSTDRWDSQLVNLATDTITNYTRGRDLDEVLTKKSKEVDSEDKDSINYAIKQITLDESIYGLIIKGGDIIDISPNLGDEEKRRLYAEALAKPEAKAIETIGGAEAVVLQKKQDVVGAGGEAGLAVMQSENLVRAAEAAKGGTVLLGAAGSNNDAMLAAILAELRKK